MKEPMSFLSAWIFGANVSRFNGLTTKPKKVEGNMKRACQN